ncbi:MAG: T9SS type A sorting domain-containing protein [Ignavibacteria bacterium]|nr:T9SS type A sorting domain-containing protein [Ignavibacteria bacterium]
MSKRKQLLFLAAVLISVISVGFYGLSSDGDPTSSFASNTNSIAVNSNNLPDALVGAWTSGAAITTMAYFGGSDSYTRNDTGWVYQVAGNTPSAAGNVVQRYNVNTNVYSTMAVLPYNTVVNGCAVLKDSLYTMGGYLNGSTPTTNFYKYDINANTWIARAPMPGAAAFCKGVGYQDSLIYVARGYDGSAVSGIVYLYNSNTNSWRTCTPIPGNRFGGAFSRSGDTLVYVGGADLSLFYNTTYRGVISSSDRSVITWTTGATCPGITTGMYRMDARPWGCKGIILTGGSTSSAFTSVSNMCYVYSPGANVWTVQANKTTAWTAGQSGSVRLANNVWKLACLSGYSGTATIAGTEIFTDTLCPAPPVTAWCEGFTAVTFPPTGWTLTGAAALWSRNAVSGFGVGVGSAKADFYNVGSGSQQLNSIVMGTPTAAGDSLIFQNAYCTFTTENDQLQILTSTNGGTTWVLLTTLNGGVAGQLVTAPPQTAAFTPSAAQWKYQRLALPVGVNRIQFNAITAFGNNLYIDSICYKPNVVGITNNNTVAKEFSLSQNYPNPFNPTTNIKFGLPSAGNVKLVVFDVLGREVTTLVNEYKTSGIYTVDFDASMLSSGVYFYRIESGDFVQTKKMLLVK